MMGGSRVGCDLEVVNWKTWVILEYVESVGDPTKVL